MVAAQAVRRLDWSLSCIGLVAHCCICWYLGAESLMAAAQAVNISRLW